ncbi:hypothetical protein IFM89_029168 [Coptis chinensis]|uniref:Pseudouridine synthase RsuA/RluA-like domain-containing protein n=1 Tax=Coptis chinensis TaxID=261450 RepID=A0A835IS15_9MAGN|nr:hypothetical protein IFM89_029168 [Coptis chinensis]
MAKQIASHLIRSSNTTTLSSRLKSYTTTTSLTKKEAETQNKNNGKWFTLPAFTSTIDATSLAKQLSKTSHTTTSTTTNALKWVTRCCPQLPNSLVHKLFRLRQVRKECPSLLATTTTTTTTAPEQRLKRVAAKDELNIGDRIFLPSALKRNKENVNDPDIIVINKPRGMPVQGGIGIKDSLDMLAATSLIYDYPEPPRLVHRLDRDSSGILVLGRTQTSAAILHSVFREKTFGASVDDSDNTKRILQRSYWALVMGSPRRSSGLISAPLGKVVLDNGKAERITIVDDTQNQSCQHAVTEYRVIESSHHGYTWLELCPLTGRKHQLRVHCAEVLGTPIVGDYKYGWQAHRNWKPMPGSYLEKTERLPTLKMVPFGLDLESGSILEKRPHLHLHWPGLGCSFAFTYAKKLGCLEVLSCKKIFMDSSFRFHMVGFIFDFQRFASQCKETTRYDLKGHPS